MASAADIAKLETKAVAAEKLIELLRQQISQIKIAQAGGSPGQAGGFNQELASMTATSREQRRSVVVVVERRRHGSFRRLALCATTLWIATFATTRRDAVAAFATLKRNGRHHDAQRASTPTSLWNGFRVVAQRSSRPSFVASSREPPSEEALGSERAAAEMPRRDWMSRTASAAAAVAAATESAFGGGRPPSVAATAATMTTETASFASSTSKTTASKSSSDPFCDPGVSVWRRGGRRVYILGTAHISEESAALAGTLVRTVRPQAVFVELDAKRVGRLSSFRNVRTSDQTTASDDSRTRVDDYLTDTSSSSSSSSASSSSSSSPSSRLALVNPVDAVRDGAVTAGSAAVGGAIAGLYSKLESQGFSAGEEFAVAIREGLALNATVVLGDRDVDLTLRRLARAIAKTDFRRVLDINADLDEIMRRSVPVEVMLDAARNGGEDLSKEQMGAFVETLKTKENVQSIMSVFRNAAPDLYEAMVGERDLFMARGLDTLDETRFDDTVAVMGMAHLEGVERNLRTWGWDFVEPPRTCRL